MTMSLFALNNREIYSIRNCISVNPMILLFS